MGVREPAGTVAITGVLLRAYASASIGKRSQCCLPTTSSISHFEVDGRTRPASRLTIISSSPSISRFRCAHTSVRASSQAPGLNFVFGVSESATER